MKLKMENRMNQVSFERKVKKNIAFKSEKLLSVLPERVRVYDNKPVETFSLREIICPGNYFGQLGQPENRLEVSGYNFIITPNKGKREGLYRAISQALTRDESAYEYIRRRVLDHILEEWEFYREEVYNGYGSIIMEMRNLRISNPDLKRIYENHALYCQSSGTLIELYAASIVFEFGFSIMISNKMIPFNLAHNRQRRFDAHGVKYYFLLTGDSREDWHWEYLAPVGPLMEIPFGKTSYLVKQAFVFSNLLPEPKPLVKNYVTPFCLSGDVVISHNGKEYFYRMTTRNTLFYILAEMLYDNIGFAETIRKTVKWRRSLLVKPIRAAARGTPKTRAKNMYEKWETHSGQYMSNFTRKPPATEITIMNRDILDNQGDPTDLQLAAHIYNFSFKLFGLDRVKNKYLIEYDCNEFKKKADLIHKSEVILFNFLVISEERKCENRWFLLEESETIKSGHHKKKLDDPPLPKNQFSKRKKRTRKNSSVLRILPRVSKYRSIPLYKDLPPKPIKKSGNIFSQKSDRGALFIPKTMPSSKDAKPLSVLKIHRRYLDIIDCGFIESGPDGHNKLTFTHPKSKYHLVRVNPSKPSTIFPLVAHQVVKMRSRLLSKRNYANSSSENITEDSTSQTEEGSSEDEEDSALRRVYDRIKRWVRQSVGLTNARTEVERINV